MTFNKFDVGDGTCEFEDDDGAGNRLTFAFNQSTGNFSATGATFDWIPPHYSDYPNHMMLIWNGIFPEPSPKPTDFFNIQAVGSTLTIEPDQSNAVFRIYSDFEMKNTIDFLDKGMSPSTPPTKTSLKSMNKFINNLKQTTTNIIKGSPYTTNITDFFPDKTLYLTTNLPINCFGSSGAKNFLTRINATSEDRTIGTIIRSNAAEDDEVSTNAKTTVSTLNFKVVDDYGNTIALEDKNLSFKLTVTEE